MAWHKERFGFLSLRGTKADFFDHYNVQKDDLISLKYSVFLINGPLGLIT